MKSPLYSNSIFAWILVGACLLLLLPLAGMQLGADVDWSGSDFLVMGLMLVLSGSSFVVLARKIAPRSRLMLAGIMTTAFLYVWAELAVGIFFSWGS